MSEPTALTAEQLAAETMVLILRGAVVYGRENNGPPMITLGDVERAADIIEAQARRIAELEAL